MKKNLLRKALIMSKYLFQLIIAEVVFSSLAFSTPVNSQSLLNKSIECKWNGIKLTDAFSDIQNKTDLFFAYSLESVEHLTIQNKGKSLNVGDFLKFISAETGLSFKLKDEIIYVYEDSLKKTHKTKIQIPSSEILRTWMENQENQVIHNYKDSLSERKIMGIVKDDNGNVLPGATVTIKGTQRGVLTNDRGEFSMTIDETEDKTLVVSYIGFIDKEIILTSSTFYSISLLQSPKALDEVLVIGYGTQKKSFITGSSSKLTEDELSKFKGISFEQQMAGKMSGVIVNQTNGQPGAASKIVIRGIGTLTAGNNPLIVVDGFPLSEGSTLNSVNPNDIESINILKDAASAAIYGSRAANGVIMVTTKNGKNNQGTIVSFDAYSGFQEQSSGVKLVDAYDFAQFLAEARDWGYVSKDPTNRSFSDPNSVRVTKKIDGKSIDGRELIDDRLIPYLEGKSGLVNTNWIDEAFRLAPLTNYNISISNGTERSRIYSSIGYFNQEGVVIGTDMKRYSAAVNFENKINNRIKFGMNLKPSFTNQNFGDQFSRSSGALALIPLSFPNYSAFNEDGSLNISEQLRNETRRIEGVGLNGTPVENWCSI